MGFVRKGRLSIAKQVNLMAYFVAGTTARTALALCGVSRKTVAYFYPRLREVIAYELEAESKAVLAGEVEVDESYFGGRRKGQRGRGAVGQAPVFGLLKRGGRVYTKSHSGRRWSSARWHLTVLSTRRVGRVTMPWMFRAFGACGSTTQSYSRTSRTLSIALSTFGVRPSVTCASSTVCRGPILDSFCKVM